MKLRKLHHMEWAVSDLRVLPLSTPCDTWALRDNEISFAPDQVASRAQINTDQMRPGDEEEEQEYNAAKGKIIP